VALSKQASRRGPPSSPPSPLSFFVFEISPIVGTRNLRNILLGRHHRPRVEERFFLFVDVEGSTSVAERIGPAAVHRFLDGVFRLASDPIGDHGGQIYQYVDDEMVVTWTAAEARVAARPIACFFAIVAVLQEGGVEVRAGVWRGAAPESGALRPVISGEIGDSKRDIVLHGDVINTAACLEQATRGLDRRSRFDQLAEDKHFSEEPDWCQDLTA